ncbi:hypothetical protein [Streptomyces sp. NPDC048341]|uniref:hypothetical protein n=1 Tax=Streptomyces sp. NPDC048341 TaxID=3154620 RepID=UPI003441AEE1
MRRWDDVAGPVDRFNLPDVAAELAQLRQGSGLTPEALKDKPFLLRLLRPHDLPDAAAKLTALVQELGDGPEAVALRHAMAVGVPPLKNTTARRRAAVELGRFFGSERTQFNAEDRAIQQLAGLVIERAEEQPPVEVRVYLPDDSSKSHTTFEEYVESQRAAWSFMQTHQHQAFKESVRRRILLLSPVAVALCVGIFFIGYWVGAGQ